LEAELLLAVIWSLAIQPLASPKAPDDPVLGFHTRAVLVCAAGTTRLIPSAADPTSPPNPSSPLVTSCELYGGHER
jgi:hypothetical protein